MATATKPAKRAQEVKEFTFLWVGKNKAGKIVRGEQRATSETVVNNYTSGAKEFRLPKFQSKASEAAARSRRRISPCLRGSLQP